MSWLVLIRGDAVGPLATFGLAGGDLQAQFLFKGSGKGAAHRVGLPSGSFTDLLDRRTLRTLQHGDYLSLLGVVSGAGLLGPASSLNSGPPTGGLFSWTYGTHKGSKRPFQRMCLVIYGISHCCFENAEESRLTACGTCPSIHPDDRHRPRAFEPSSLRRVTKR